MKHNFSREMTITHKDFLRLLPYALEQRSFTYANQCVELMEQGRSVRISLGDEMTRKIGVLSLPLTLVELEFEGFEDSEVDKFIRRFDMAYQKGGG